MRRWPGPVRGRLAGRGGGFRGRICWSRRTSEPHDGRGLDRRVLPVAGLLVIRVAATDARRRGAGGPAPAGLEARGAAQQAGARPGRPARGQARGAVGPRCQTRRAAVRAGRRRWRAQQSGALSEGGVRSAAVRPRQRVARRGAAATWRSRTALSANGVNGSNGNGIGANGSGGTSVNGHSANGHSANGSTRDGRSANGHCARRACRCSAANGSRPAMRRNHRIRPARRTELIGQLARDAGAAARRHRDSAALPAGEQAASRAGLGAAEADAVRVGGSGRGRRSRCPGSSRARRPRGRCRPCGRRPPCRPMSAPVVDDDGLGVPVDSEEAWW